MIMLTIYTNTIYQHTFVAPIGYLFDQTKLKELAKQFLVDMSNVTIDGNKLIITEYHTNTINTTPRSLIEETIAKFIVTESSQFHTT